MNKIFLVITFLFSCIVLNGQDNIKDQTAAAFSMSYEKGIKYFFKDNLQKAEIYFRKALKTKPDDVNTLKYLAEISIAEQNVSMVEYYYNKVIELNPDDEDALTNLGVIYINSGKLNLAEKLILKAIDHQPSNELALFNLGVLYGAKGEYNSATKILNKVISLNPDNSKYYQTIGLYYLSQNLYENAEAAFLKSLELDNNLIEARKGLVIIYQNRKQFNRSDELLDELEAISLKIPQLNLLKAIQEYLNGKINSAVHYSQQEIKNYPLEVDTYYFLSDLYKSKGKKLKADSVMSKIVELGISTEQPFVYQIIKPN